MRTIALILATAALTLSNVAGAQERSGSPDGGTITGAVVDDESAQPIASATVGVWSAADSSLVTGAITGADGRFALQGLSEGRYFIRVSFVGYISETIDELVIEADGGTVELGRIRLRPDTQLLDEVEVVGERSTVQVQIDRTVYNTADDPISAGGTATNVLETIPSIDVDVDGNVSLRGSGNVAILINGRPAPVGAEFLASYLQQLPAGSIERVEVIPNPSARYEPDGMGGIINIVLKQDAERGWGGTVSAGGDSRGGYNGNGNVTYGRGRLNVAAAYGYRRNEGVGGGSSFRINRYADPLTFLDQVEDEDETGNSHRASLSADYRLSDRTTLNASGELGMRDEVEVELNTYLLMDAAENPMLRYTRTVEEIDDRWNGDLRVGLRHTFGPLSTGGRRNGRVDHTLSIEGRQNVSANTSDETYLERLADGGAIRERQQALNTRDRQYSSLQADYVRPLGALKFEAGYKGDRERLGSTFFSESFDESAGGFLPDVGLNNEFVYERNLHAVYMQLGRQSGRLGIQTGLRYEAARTEFDLHTENETFENSYQSLFPSAFFTYELSDAHTLKASYSRRINRPRIWFLNPFPSFDDPLNIRMGNPSLQPEYIDALEAGYVRFTPWGSLSLTPYYRRTTDVIRRIQTLRDDGVTVRTVRNLDTSSSSGLELIVSLEDRRIFGGLRGYGSFEGFRVATDGSSVDTDLQNDAFGWGGRLNVSYALGDRLGLGGAMDLQGTLRYRAPMKTEQGRTGSRSWSDLAVRQQLLGDRASLSLRVRDVFGTAGFNYTIDQPNLFHEFERDWGAQQISLTFSYSFGRPERDRDRRRSGPDDGGDDMGDLELE